MANLVNMTCFSLCKSDLTAFKMWLPSLIALSISLVNISSSSSYDALMKCDSDSATLLTGSYFTGSAECFRFSNELFRSFEKRCFLSNGSSETLNGLTMLSMLCSLYLTFFAVTMSFLRELIDDFRWFERSKLDRLETEKPVPTFCFWKLAELFYYLTSFLWPVEGQDESN